MSLLKKISIISLVASLFVGISAVWAVNLPEQANQAVPEQAGIYDVSGHPELKLKVFVHEPKANQPAKNNVGKPNPQTPQEICNSTLTADPDSTSVVAGAGWTMPAHWVYNLNLNSVPSAVGSTNLATIANSAFGQWTTAINNSVTIEQGMNYPAAKRSGYPMPLARDT